MTPVDMKTESDCMRACVASLLGRSLEEVPDFGNEDNQTDRVQAFLYELGLHLVTVEVEPGNPWQFQGYYIASGPAAYTPDLMHGAIYRDGVLVHDPHPERAGLAEVQYVDYIIPLDIAVW